MVTFVKRNVMNFPNQESLHLLDMLFKYSGLKAHKSNTTIALSAQYRSQDESTSTRGSGEVAIPRALEAICSFDSAICSI